MARYDVIVIGGGPSGMMAAGRAAEKGARVLLLEKNSSLGRKLLITGGGRSNITNAELNLNIFLEKFRENAKYLFSPFSKFGPKECLDFFRDLEMPTKIEAEKRVFPQSDSAVSVLEALKSYMKQGKVDIRYNSVVSRIEQEKSRISAIYLKDGERLEARAYILATGGKSRPETGSTGEGFNWLQFVGHTIVEPDAALVPVTVREKWVKQLSGMSVKNAKVTVFQNGAKQLSKKGKVLFTHVGLSGPLVLNMSKDIGEHLKYGKVEVSIDFFPELDAGATDRMIQALFQEHQNKKTKNILGKIVTPLLSPILGTLSGIDQEKFINKVSREERLKLVKVLKDFRMTASGLLGVEKAIVTSGGVDLKEVDFRTLQSRLYPNLYLVGDILNIDRPSGGYSLQLCWTTGFVAGESAAKNI